MNRVAGVDYSTLAVDVVTLPWDTDEPEWRRIEAKGPSAFHRALQFRGKIRRATNWLAVDRVDVEKAHSHGFKVTYSLALIEGIILAEIPSYITVNEHTPDDWRRTLCGKAKSSKEQVQERLRELGFTLPLPADHNAWDALGIAWAAREENRRAVELANTEQAEVPAG